MLTSLSSWSFGIISSMLSGLNRIWNYRFPIRMIVQGRPILDTYLLFGYRIQEWLNTLKEYVHPPSRRKRQWIVIYSASSNIRWWAHRLTRYWQLQLYPSFQPVKANVSWRGRVDIQSLTHIVILQDVQSAPSCTKLRVTLRSSGCIVDNNSDGLYSRRSKIYSTLSVRKRTPSLVSW
jgi:hypothetical protein